MKLAQFFTHLLIIPLVLFNPEIFSSVAVQDTAPLAVQQSASLMGAANANALAHPNTFASPAVVANVKNEEANTVVWVYVPNVLALSVVQQPTNNPAYVSTTPESATQFRLAADYGTTGLIAHNYLSGAFFFNLALGQDVNVIYSNGEIHRYRIFALRHFQALRPTDPLSNFVDIDNGQNTPISNAELFHQIYSGGDRVVFQTCITREGNTSWGRLFVIATPIS